MHAQEYSLTYFCQNNYYVIPFFQRDYVWGEDNWSQLWDDLSLNSEDCYLGTFIVKDKSKHNTANGTLNNCKSIIDGQQRLTTISLLVKALIDVSRERGNGADLYEKFIYYKKENRKGFEYSIENQCKLIQSHVDSINYENVIKSENGFLDKIDTIPENETEDGYSRVLHCYKYFVKKFRAADPEAIERVICNINTDNKKSIVVIELSEQEDEQKIFDSVNSTGVPLTVSEIIKNSMFEALSCKLDPQNIELSYENTWKSTFESSSDVIKQWTSMKGSGQNARSYIDSFFYCYAIINGFFDPTKDRISRLATVYKRYFSDCNIDGGMVDEICRYAKLYYKYFVNLTEAISYGQVTERVINILTTMKYSTFDPYVLKLLHDNDNSINDKLCYLEKYVMRHYAAHTEQNKSFSADCVAMIQGTFDFKEKLLSDEISDEKIANSFNYMPTNSRAKLILFWIEMRRQNENQKSDSSVGRYEFKPFQLEHIMPQTLGNKWQTIQNENGQDITKQFVYQIGNMTLLKGKLNDAISNGSFREKVEGTNNEPGIKDSASFSITKEIIEKSNWGKCEIEARTQALIEEFNNAWPSSVE